MEWQRVGGHGWGLWTDLWAVTMTRLPRSFRRSLTTCLLPLSLAGFACSNYQEARTPVPVSETAPTTVELTTTTEPATTTTTEPEPEPTTTPPPTIPRVAPPSSLLMQTTTAVGVERPSGGDYGGWAIPAYIVSCETGGTFDWYAYNASSGASGPYQLIPLHFGGELAMNQSRAAQHAKAAELWDGGRGRLHWAECL